MKHISLVFEDDVQREDIDALKAVRGCLGVSAFRNTVNLYFRHIDTVALASLATVVRKQITGAGVPVTLSQATLDEEASTAMIYAALRAEAVAA